MRKRDWHGKSKNVHFNQTQATTNEAQVKGSDHLIDYMVKRKKNENG